MSVTHGTGSGDQSLVATPSSSTIATKAISVDKNVTLSSDANAVTITYDTPACRISKSTDTSVSTGSTSDIDFDTEQYDPTDMHESMTNPRRVTIATDGLYSIQATVTVAATSPNGLFYVRIWKYTGSFTQIGTQSVYLDNSGGQQIFNVATTDYLENGDYIYVDVQNSTGVTCTLKNFSNYGQVLSVTRVGDN